MRRFFDRLQLLCYSLGLLQLAERLQRWGSPAKPQGLVAPADFLVEAMSIDKHRWEIN